VAVDDAGNVYVAFVRRKDPNSPTSEYDIALAWSTDGGNAFSGGTPEHPGAPQQVNRDTGTHYMPRLAAGGTGGVDVVWYGTPFVEGATPTAEGSFPLPAPGSAMWNVYIAKSLDVPARKPFAQSIVTDHSNYFGDIWTSCSTKEIPCGLDRILYDDFGVAVGPDGGARVTWTDTRESLTQTCYPHGETDKGVGCQTGHIYFACQNGGRGVAGQVIAGCGQDAPAGTPPTEEPTG